jgi:hypothetical protein
MGFGCGNFSKEIWEGIILNDTAPLEFTEHVRTCQSCRMELSGLTDISDKLSSIPYNHPVLKEAFTAQVLRKVNSDAVPAHKKGWHIKGVELIRSVGAVNLKKAIPFIAAGIIPILLTVQWFNLNKPHYSTGISTTDSVSMVGEAVDSGVKVLSNGVTYLIEDDDLYLGYNNSQPIRRTAGVTEYH